MLNKKLNGHFWRCSNEWLLTVNTSSWLLTSVLKDVEGVNNNGAEADGLYRTEFLYMFLKTSQLKMSGMEAYRLYLREWMVKPVVVRTMDIGGGQELPCFRYATAKWTHSLDSVPFVSLQKLEYSIPVPKSVPFFVLLFVVQLRIMFNVILRKNSDTAKQFAKKKQTFLWREGVAVADDIKLVSWLKSCSSNACRSICKVDFMSDWYKWLDQYSVADHERASFTFTNHIAINPSLDQQRYQGSSRWR